MEEADVGSLQGRVECALWDFDVHDILHHDLMVYAGWFYPADVNDWQVVVLLRFAPNLVKCDLLVAVGWDAAYDHLVGSRFGREVLGCGRVAMSARSGCKRFLA